MIPYPQWHVIDGRRSLSEGGSGDWTRFRARVKYTTSLQATATRDVSFWRSRFDYRYTSS